MQRKLNLFLSATFLISLCLLNACKKESAVTQPTAETVTPFPTAIGSPVGNAQTKEIGTAGGSITTPDGRITLAIPAGALSSSTSISIQPIENTTPLGIGFSYDFLPNGQQFAKPVIVTLHYNNEELAGTAPELLEFGYQNNQNVWRGAGNLLVNKTAQTVSASIKHFSRWSFYATFKMTPEQKTLLVNQTALLQVMKLPYSEDPDPNNLEELLHVLGQPQLLAADKVSNWLVNGQQSRQANSNGWLSGSSANEKQYHAPADIPASNPVAVSADINTGKGSITVVSHMNVQKEVSFEFSCNGQSFKDLDGTVTASTSAGTLYVFMMSKVITGDKIPSLVLEMGEGFHGKGSYAFGEKNLVACSVTTYPYEWHTEYYEEDSAMPKFGSGTVTIDTWGNIGELVSGTISGTLHFQKTVLNVTEHKTAALNARFSYIRNE
ncbi:hypothetical protein [Flavisolibacter ginsengisoli]|jgi:hypothetical protein|uniref:ZU5 domain-containing protein n=1 Tax=Flavisolibacter ginsengisoli DSM 18119 TaxID=1121884 RepID=A0A1M4SWC9_9BACT|nr:hypothetical protein [Flavisolibacter ginsengisoli]SHE36495.1 hypothetical protein SAMN02745131_00254 [Flavisolibacter ginsengisoli DSM 18119]